MPLRSLYKYKPEYWKNNYDKAINEVREYEKRLATTVKVYRSMTINQFGVYNFDCLIKREDYYVNVKTKFVLSTDTTKLYTKKVTCILEDIKSLVKVYNGDNIWLNPIDTNYRIFTITEDLNVAIFPIEKYNNINFDSLRTVENKTFTFKLNVIDKEIKTKKDLKEILKY
ncbi:MAG: hypothetical protein U9R54_02235 [Bacteroidota bacterium]|nr:hypothetical protein [Bacteroidota bacterium]